VAYFPAAGTAGAAREQLDRAEALLRELGPDGWMAQAGGATGADRSGRAVQMGRAKCGWGGGLWVLAFGSWFFGAGSILLRPRSGARAG